MHIYDLDPAGATFLAKLHGLDTAPGDRFGVSVELYDARMVVGASHADELGADAGAAYVFERKSVAGPLPYTFVELQKLLPCEGHRSRTRYLLCDRTG